MSNKIQGRTLINILTDINDNNKSIHTYIMHSHMPYTELGKYDTIKSHKNKHTKMNTKRYKQIISVCACVCSETIVFTHEMYNYLLTGNTGNI